MPKIDTDYTDGIVCPYCGHVERNDLYEYFGNSDEATLDCGECGEEFTAWRHVSISYSTDKMKVAPSPGGEVGNG